MLAGILVKGNWRGRRRTPLALTLKKAKLTRPESPYWYWKLSSAHRVGLYSLTCFEKRNKKESDDMYVQSVSHQTREEEQKTKCFDQIEIKKRFF